MKWRPPLFDPAVAHPQSIAGGLDGGRGGQAVQQGGGGGVIAVDRHHARPAVLVLRQKQLAESRAHAVRPLGYRVERLAEAGQTLGITVEGIARGRDGQCMPAGICWVVERSFAWLTRYRRLNTIVERSKDHLIVFVAISFSSILSRRLKRLVAEELSA